MPNAQSLTPAHAKGGTGSVGLPMDVTPQRVQATEIRVLLCAFTVASRKRGASQGGRGAPWGSDPADAQRIGDDAPMIGSTVASRKRDPAPRCADPCSTLHCSPQRVQATDTRVLLCAFTVASRKRGAS